MAARNIRRSLAPVLFPVSLVYSVVTGIRNKLFDLNIIKSTEFDFPVISVGNITVGGTGKTPHVEYLVNLLSGHYKIAVLSRGYRRSTKGFILADINSAPEDIGDESCQINRKFEDVPVAVDENRVRGIRMLKKKIKNLRCVILDDAYQHRKVHPGVSILLIDYNRPLRNDRMLPLGNLRENRHNIHRANIIIVTKVPHKIKPIEKRLWVKDLNLFPYQFLYFTSFQYGKLTPVFLKNGKKMEFNDLDKKSTGIILVTGIANPDPLYDKVKKYSRSVYHYRFPDHHAYSAGHLEDIYKRLSSLRGTIKLIVTTEKDAVKMRQLASVDTRIKELIYYVPIKIKFLGETQEEFDQIILKYVGKNKPIGRLHR